MRIEDALKEALALNEYPSAMTSMGVNRYGKGAFDSYLAIQKNPTTAGELPMDSTVGKGTTVTVTF
ncbi:MAG: hypothetical protein IJO59_01540 [Clostridia bacterium]|nr:hypothetical protein [Clostridia bacterium]